MASVMQIIEQGVDRHQRRDGALLRRREQDIAKLWGYHHEILRRTLLGEKPKRIAEALGVTKQTVINVLNSPIAQEKLLRMQAEADLVSVDVARQIKEIAPKAIRVMEELLEAEHPSVRLNAAKDLLDRAGHQAVKRVDARVLTGQVTPELLEQLNERARIAAEAARSGAAAERSGDAYRGSSEGALSKAASAAGEAELGGSTSPMHT